MTKCSQIFCAKKFHIECARRSLFCFEQQEENNKINNVYCKEHTPLKLRRILDIN